MISYLKGTVLLRDDPYIILTVGDVGYKILVPTDLLASCEKGKPAEIFIYTHVREDALDLIGFKTHHDLKLFELLISVSGIGPKTAIGAFSCGTGNEIIAAIQSGDVNFFTRVPRLGKKNAQKIIIELKNKVGGTTDLNLQEEDTPSSSELLSALRSLGYSDKEAYDTVKKVGNEGKTVEEKLKLALKRLGK